MIAVEHLRHVTRVALGAVADRGFALGVSRGWHSHLDVLEYRLKDETPPAFWDIWRRYDGVYDKRYA